MNIEQIDEIIECLPKGRTLFPYFPGRYAPMLLSWLFDDACTVEQVKRSRYAGLLQKPLVQNVLSQHGKSTLCMESLSLAWTEPHEDFLLTLGRWGGEPRRWQQTSRNGHNLVLQLNLHEGYRRSFEKVLPDEYQWRFQGRGHPVMEKGQRNYYRQTLGWVRLDLDFSTGEALIEEIQNDWLRDLLSLQSFCARFSDNEDEYKALFAYTAVVQRRLCKIWDEALLSAALWFLKEELGLTTIWYHTFDTGNRLKNINYGYPPRSIYTSLPRKFCFTKTCEQPIFLSRDKSYQRLARKVSSPQWYQMQL